MTSFSDCSSWPDFVTRMFGLSAKEKGDLFELVTKHFLTAHPTYRALFSDVWLRSEIPLDVCDQVRLPAQDMGIDILARTRAGSFWAVQCKFRSDAEVSLTWDEISTFTGLAFGICRNIEYGLVAYTGRRHTSVLADAQRVGLLSEEVWSQLDEDFFTSLPGAADRVERAPINPYAPRPHQLRAIQSAEAYFGEAGHRRGKLIMPCATGKSLLGFWFAQLLEARTVVIAVPSLALIQQTLPVWLREYVPHGKQNTLRWICVCSDQTVAANDSLVTHTQDLGYPCLTCIPALTEWLRTSDQASSRLIFVTYQSGKVLAEACRSTNTEIDLGILDEAHRTVGDRDRLFSHLLFDNNISMKRRIFMTATERRYSGQSDNIVSMDAEETYGLTFHSLTFKDALDEEPPILSDYKIVTMLVSQAEVARLIEENKVICPDLTEWDDEVEAQTLASLVALHKAIAKYDIKHAVSFHSSISRAARFQALSEAYSRTHPQLAHLEAFHVSGQTPTSVRKKTIDGFASSPRSLITNARCLTEGVDVPNIDAVLFANPKQSVVDIVQAVGRALRTHPNKTCSYVLIPMITKGETNDTFFEGDGFAAIISVLRALASNDQRIVEYFRDRQNSASRDDGLIVFNIDATLAPKIDVEAFATTIEIKAWDRLAKLSMRPYEEAVAFAQSLGLKSRKEWQAYCRGERPDLSKRPSDVPAGPTKSYRGVFQEAGGWGAWLGTGNKSRKYSENRPFVDALHFVQALNLQTSRQWMAYCRGELSHLPPKPADIPSDPRLVYREEFAQNGKMPGWLGSFRERRTCRTYDETLAFVHSLGLKSEVEWRAYLRGDFPHLPAKPSDIPPYPRKHYKDVFKSRGGWAAWLNFERPHSWCSYSDAVAFVRDLGLENSTAWEDYCKGKRPYLPAKPSNIPRAPKKVYGTVFRDNGGWQGWLGTKKMRGSSWRPYEEAVVFVRALGLSGQADWQDYYRGRRTDLPLKPEDIPANPYEAYGKAFVQKGGLGSWLGTRQASRSNGRDYRSYMDAVAFVKTLRLSSATAWRAYASGKRADLPPKPKDIPTGPFAAYGSEFADNGGWNGWLGKVP